MEPNPLLLRPPIDLLDQLWMVDDDDCEAINGTDDW
jgi:hypothetical protein